MSKSNSDKGNSDISSNNSKHLYKTKSSKRSNSNRTRKGSLKEYLEKYMEGE